MQREWLREYTVRYIVLGTTNSSEMEGKRWKDIISSNSHYLVLTSDTGADFLKQLIGVIDKYKVSE